MAAKPQSYTNDRGETMAMKYEYIHIIQILVLFTLCP